MEEALAEIKDLFRELLPNIWKGAAAMSVRDEIIELLEQENIFPISINEETDLYRDLHFDSLSYVGLLLDIEEQYKIKIELAEMERCLAAGQLIALVESKTGRVDG